MKMTLVNLAPLNFLFDASEDSPYQLGDAVKNRHVPTDTNRTKDNKNRIRSIYIKRHVLWTSWMRNLLPHSTGSVTIHPGGFPAFLNRIVSWYSADWLNALFMVLTWSSLMKRAKAIIDMHAARCELQACKWIASRWLWAPQHT